LVPGYNIESATSARTGATSLPASVSRRVFNKLVGATVLGAIAESRPALGDPIHQPEEIVLEDHYLRCEFSRETGALVGLLSKKSGWLIQRRAELGVSFRLLAPLPDRRDNFILGHRQRLVSAEQSSSTKLRLTWKDLQSEHGGQLPITFTSVVNLENGSLTFVGEVVNGSDLTIETIDYPYLGDLNAPKTGPPRVF